MPHLTTASANLRKTALALALAACSGLMASQVAAADIAGRQDNIFLASTEPMATSSAVTHNTDGDHERVAPELKLKDSKFDWKIYGEIGLGGYMKTGGEYAHKYEANNYVEAGLELKYGGWYSLWYVAANPVQTRDGESYVPGHGYGGFEMGTNSLYLGYEFDNGTRLQYGVFGSSPLDDVAYWTDFTPEFGYGHPITPDLFNYVKVENLKGKFKWSVAASDAGDFNEEDDALIHTGKHDSSSDKFTYPTAVINGYARYDWADGYGVMFGSEVTDGTGAYFTLAALMGDYGLRVWHHTGRGGKSDMSMLGDETGVIASIKYEMFTKFWLSASYTHYVRNFDQIQGDPDGEFGEYDSTTSSFVNGGFWWEYMGGSMASAFDIRTYTGASKNRPEETMIFLEQFIYF